jgi:hypothetical protein
LNRFRGDREGNEGVGNDDREGFFRGRGDSGRIVKDLRIPEFRLCFFGGDGGRDIVELLREFGKGKGASGEDG